MAGDAVAMRKRLNALCRVVEVKRQQVRLSEFALARLELDSRKLIEEQSAIMAALNAEQPLHGLFVETMARHLKALSGKIDALENAKAAERARLIAQKGQLKHAERLCTGAEREHARAEENKELTEIVEAVSARRAASLP